MNKKIYKQAQWWKYAAGTLPFFSLALVVLLDIVGWTDLHNKILFTILIVFFTSGVLWWWWAIDKIVYLTSLLIETENKFIEIKKEIANVREEVKSLDTDRTNQYNKY